MSLRRLSAAACSAVLLSSFASTVLAQNPSTIAARGLAGLTAPLVWSGGMPAESTGSRRAVLVAADQTRDRPDWRVNFASTNVTAVRRALVARSVVAESGIRTLQGENVHANAIEAAITDAASGFRGRNNLLLLYFTGHAYVEGDALVFFTFFTREGPTGNFENTLPRLELLASLARAKLAARARGAEFQVVVIVDACRVRVLAPAPSVSIVAAADWEWYGTARGRFAEAPAGDDPSPFTAAFVSALEQSARLGDGSLLRIVQRTNRTTTERTSGRQVPELLRPVEAADIEAFVQRPSVSFAFRVVDALSGTPIPQAGGRLGREALLNGAGVLGMPPGRFLLQVRAPGYLSRTEEVEISSAASGQVLEIALHPALALVVGQVAPPRAVRVRWEGRGSIEGYHIVDAPNEADGRFLLRLPPLGEQREIVLLQAGAPVAAVTIPPVPARFERPPSSVYEGVPVYDVGVVTLPSTASDAPLLYRRASEAATSAPLPEGVSDAALANPPALRDAIARDRLHAVARYVELGRYQLARMNVTELLGSGAGMDEAGQRSLEGLLAWVSLREGLADTGTATLLGLKEQVGVGRPMVETALRTGIVQRTAERARAIAERTPLVVADLQRAIASLASALIGRSPSEAAWLPVIRYGSEQIADIAAPALRTLLESRRWVDAIALAVSTRAAGSGSSVDSLFRQVMPVALRGALDGAIGVGMAAGEWRQALALAAQVNQDYLHDPALAALARIVQDEAIPLETRRRYEQAQAAFADGSFVEAWGLYGAAADSANPHYTQLIDAQREYLRQQLFIQYLSRAELLELDDNGTAALREYLLASEFDDRVDERITGMLGRHYAVDGRLLARWTARRVGRLAAPAVLVVASSPPGEELLIDGSPVGRTPFRREYGAAAIPRSLTIMVRRGGWRVEQVVRMSAQRMTSVLVAVPGDTLDWPLALASQDLVERNGLAARFRPSKAAPSIPEARRRVTWLAALSAGGFVAGTVIGLAAHDNSACKYGAGTCGTLGALGGLLAGAYAGWRADKSVFDSALRRHDSFPARLADWQAATNVERNRWYDAQLAPFRQEESRRLAGEIARVRSLNEATRAANARLAPPLVTSAVMAPDVVTP